MASACVNNIGVSPENFLDCSAPHSSFGWLSPRISFSREDSKVSKSSSAASPPEKKPDLESFPAGDFEFRLDDPAVMLPADELFSDGKLMPLQLKPAVFPVASEEVRSPEIPKSCRRSDGDLSFANDPYLFSPKAPRCSSRWRELLGLKKLYQSTHNKQENPKTTSSSSTSTSSSTKSIRLFLYRNSKTSSSSSTSDPSLSLPLLNSDSDSLSFSSNRLSLSSTTSTHDDFPRHSLDTPNPNPNPARLRPVRSTGLTRVGRSLVRRAPPEPRRMVRGVSVDSPRMNSSGRVLFQSLERSSSSPSSFNGGRPRYNYSHRGMERSSSANVVRVTPVLNVPVCSLRGSSKAGVFGFGQLFSSSSSSSQSQKKESSNNNGGRSHSHHQQPSSSISRNKKEIS